VQNFAKFEKIKMATAKPEVHKKPEKTATQSSADAFRLPPPKPLIVVEEAMDKKWLNG